MTDAQSLKVKVLVWKGILLGRGPNTCSERLDRVISKVVASISIVPGPSGNVKTAYKSRSQFKTGVCAFCTRWHQGHDLY